MTATETVDGKWPAWEVVAEAWDLAHAGEMPRDEERVMLRVRVKPVNGTVVCGQHVAHGTQHALVYKSEVPKALSLAEDDSDRQRWAIGQNMFEARLAEVTRECAGDETMARAIIAESPASYYYSLPGSKRGKPLASVDVGPTVPPPRTQRTARSEANAEMMTMIEALAAAIKKSK